jgi:hypothetical protein
MATTSPLKFANFFPVFTIMGYALIIPFYVETPQEFCIPDGFRRPADISPFQWK